MRNIAPYPLDFNHTPLGRWSAAQRRPVPRVVRRLASAYGLTTATAAATAALAGFPLEVLRHG